jgi:hypothetical protein
MKRWLVSVAAAIVTNAMTADAHHSIAGVYDSSRHVTIEGIVAQFQLVNPHPFLLVDVKNSDGRVLRWQLEMDNRGELAAIGVTADTLESGDHVVITGSPARAEPQRLYIRRLDRPADGFWYEQVGSSPRIRTPISRSGAKER